MAEAEENAARRSRRNCCVRRLKLAPRSATTSRKRTRTLRVCAGTSSRSPDNHGLAPIAASTHPFSSWTDQKHTEKDRYDQLTHEMQGAARRLVICGMHVHVGIDDDELRIDLMNQMSYFLPHLLALSCSSPFWHGRDTGLKSYRLTIFDALPRTGCAGTICELGRVRTARGDSCMNAGLIEDSTRIWWDLRPSGRYPDA